MEKKNGYGVYFIFKNMEQGRTFRISVPRFPTQDPCLPSLLENSFLKQYEKFSRFLRNEPCSNNLRDFGLKQGLNHLDAVRRDSRS